jgi:hypothetical protein
MHSSTDNTPTDRLTGARTRAHGDVSRKHCMRKFRVPLLYMSRALLDQSVGTSVRCCIKQQRRQHVDWDLPAKQSHELETKAALALHKASPGKSQGLMMNQVHQVTLIQSTACMQMTRHAAKQLTCTMYSHEQPCTVVQLVHSQMQLMCSIAADKRSCRAAMQLCAAQSE